MTQCIWMKKQVFIHLSAEKELSKFSRSVGLKFKALIEILETEGRLEEPFAKKIIGKNNFFEARVRHQGQWRAIYAYALSDIIIILSAFAKKTQKTPIKELSKAQSRLTAYLSSIKGK